ncbi:hypothetical protein FJZ26_05025 [Candidatus Parvarchaeota archaeon]|nr:hypothetical protein [Candidatus Parvarchaeota archaeon]
MITPCESIVKYYIPALKAGIVQSLYASHGMSQVRIAKALGMTQAQVSKYITHDYSHEIEKAQKTALISKNSKQIAMRIARDGIGSFEISRMVCTTCATINPDYDCLFSTARK